MTLPLFLFPPSNSRNCPKDSVVYGPAITKSLLGKVNLAIIDCCCITTCNKSGTKSSTTEHPNQENCEVVEAKLFKCLINNSYGLLFSLDLFLGRILI